MAGKVSVVTGAWELCHSFSRAGGEKGVGQHPAEENLSVSAHLTPSLRWAVWPGAPEHPGVCLWHSAVQRGCLPESVFVLKMKHCDSSRVYTVNC